METVNIPNCLVYFRKYDVSGKMISQRKLNRTLRAVVPNEQTDIVFGDATIDGRSFKGVRSLDSGKTVFVDVYP